MQVLEKKNTIFKIQFYTLEGLLAYYTYKTKPTKIKSKKKVTLKK